MQLKHGKIETVGYKIFKRIDYSKVFGNGSQSRRAIMPMTIVHPFDGSRTLLMDQWLKADEKVVYNPGKKHAGKEFLSGWHFFAKKDEAIAYLNSRFKRPWELSVCRVKVVGRRNKPRSRGCLLATFMYISASSWRNRVAGSCMARGDQ